MSKFTGPIFIYPHSIQLDAFLSSSINLAYDSLCPSISSNIYASLIISIFAGISTPLGQGIQYLQSVQFATILSLYIFSTFERISKSSAFNEFGLVSEAV